VQTEVLKKIIDYWFFADTMAPPAGNAFMKEYWKLMSGQVYRTLSEPLCVI
jgi:hypothetical protein